MAPGYPTGLQVNRLPSAGLPRIVVVPAGLDTPVPVNPIGVTGPGVLPMMIRVAPSPKPGVAGSNSIVNWHEEPG